MAYDKKTWASLEIINRDELQHMEDGIDAVDAALVEIQAEIDAIPDMNLYMPLAIYDPDQDGKVNTSVIADTLANTVPKSYADIASEIDSDIITHTNISNAHHARYTDAEAQAAVNVDTDHGTTAPHNYRTDEEIRDVCSSMFVAGTNVAIIVDDNTNTVTISETGPVLTPDMVTKINSVEIGATADQNASEIVTLINASSSIIDANNVDLSNVGPTEAQITKLNGIETGATADQNAEEIVTLINASGAIINPTNIGIINMSTVIERGFIGELVLGDTIRIYNPRVGRIQSAALISATQPIDNALMIDVRKNGVASANSIFSSDTPMMLSTSAVSTNGVYSVNGVLDNSQATLVAGDILRAYVTQTGNTADVSICLEVIYNSVVVDSLVKTFDNITFASMETKTGTTVDTTLARKLWIFASNTGGNNTTVYINALPTADSTSPALLGVLNLNNTTTSGGYVITDLPPFIQAVVSNNDTANSTVVTVQFSISG